MIKEMAMHARHVSLDSGVAATGNGAEANGSAARTVALAYLAEVRRKELSIVREICFMPTPTVELYAVMNAPRSERRDQSKTRAAREFRKFQKIHSEMHERHRLPYTLYVLSAPDTGQREIDEVTRDAVKMTVHTNGANENR